MKKFLLAVTALVCSFTASHAQMGSGAFNLSESSLYYGVRMGFTSASTDLATIDLGSKTGMSLAGIVGIRCSQSVPLFLESGLYYTQRGGKKGSTSVSLNYLEIPVLIKYGIDLKPVAILPFVGPYFSWGVGGKIKAYEDHGKMSSFRDGCYKHGDMGFKLGCGVEWNMLYAELGYQFGVANISDNDAWDAHGNAFFMNFGINF